MEVVPVPVKVVPTQVSLRVIWVGFTRNTVSTGVLDSRARVVHRLKVNDYEGPVMMKVADFDKGRGRDWHSRIGD